MGDLTKNISRHELRCKCGNCSVTIQDHEPIIGIVQGVCDRIADKYDVDKVQLDITSAARCREDNQFVGSNDESQHIRCNAMDIKIFVGDVQMPPDLVAEYLLNDVISGVGEVGYIGGVGIYNTFTHIDTRNKIARW